MNAGLAVALTIPAVIAATLVTTQPLKALLEIFFPPTNRAHDALVQALALVVGLIWGLVFIWAVPSTRDVAVAAIIAILLGLGGGSAAIGTQRMLTTSTRHPVEPPVPGQAPVRAVPPERSFTSVPYTEVSSEEPIRPQDP